MTTTSYHVGGEVDGLFDEVSIVDAPGPSPAVRRVERVADLDDLLEEADGRSVPDSHVLSRIFWRSVRTLAPLMMCDLLALALAGAAAHTSLWWAFGGAGHLPAWASPLVLLPLVVAYWMSDLYSEIWVHPVVELRQLTQVNTVWLLAAAAGAMLAQPLPLFCVAAWPLVVVLVPLLRTVCRWYCSTQRWWGYPTLVIGSGEGAREVADVLLEVPRSGLRPALVTDVSRQLRASVLPVVNEPGLLESMVQVHAIQHAVVSLPALSTAELTETLDRYSRLVPHLLVLSDCSTLPMLWGVSRKGGQLSGMEMRNGLMLATLQGIKRVIDLVVVLVALVPGLPLMLGVAVAMKLSDPGPLLYGHTRIGRHGRAFRVWKFRTMRIDGDAVLQEFLNRSPEARAEWERDRKLRDDPRVTKLGRFLRKTSLDELPQIWNVLKGDMSLVGPRPIVNAEIARYGEIFRLYAAVKPGISGLWQVSGRNGIGYDERVQLDEFYIRHWSPWLDMYVLAKTVVALLNRSGAY